MTTVDDKKVMPSIDCNKNSQDYFTVLRLRKSNRQFVLNVVHIFVFLSLNQQGTKIIFKILYIFVDTIKIFVNLEVNKLVDIKFKKKQKHNFMDYYLHAMLSHTENDNKLINKYLLCILYERICSMCINCSYKHLKNI